MPLLNSFPFSANTIPTAPSWADFEDDKCAIEDLIFVMKQEVLVDLLGPYLLTITPGNLFQNNFSRIRDISEAKNKYNWIVEKSFVILKEGLCLGLTENLVGIIKSYRKKIFDQFFFDTDVFYAYHFVGDLEAILRYLIEVEVSDDIVLCEIEECYKDKFPCFKYFWKQGRN